MDKTYKTLSKITKILLVDDSLINRALLTDILSDEYTIVEAENGKTAIKIIQEDYNELSLILLDLSMPEVDGYEVLKFLNESDYIRNLPVIIISAETSPEKIKEAYELGATDFISRPFDSFIVHKRISNTILLYNKQKNLVNMVVNQISKNQKDNNLMVAILSQLVEFRNGESGLHVQNIRKITKLLLTKLIQKTDKYKITEDDISMICLASALHDIGKITIPDEILNKPGKLTDDEFSVIKKHSAAGADLLNSLASMQNEPLIKIATEICRWHHERYDGCGYPDKLSGDSIPISVQVVAIADVFDALTSKRCYKEAYEPQKALKMILEGECGSFNPLLLECLIELSDEICKSIKEPVTDSLETEDKTLLNQKAVAKANSFSDLTDTLEQLSTAKTKIEFLTENIDEIVFSYNKKHQLIKFSKNAAKLLNLPEATFQHPLDNKELLQVINEDFAAKIITNARTLSPEKPRFEMDCSILINNELKQMLIHGLGIFSVENSDEYSDFICIMTKK